MRKVVALLALLLVSPRLGRAQVADSIKKAEIAYAASNFELARSLFSSILAGKMQVTTEDRVTAYKYLGGYWALQGRADSASGYFVPMLDLDPFATLDQRDFAQDEQNAFNRARLQIFKIGIQPVLAKTVLNPLSTDPKDKIYTFRIASTHLASIEVTLVNLRADQTQGTETFPTISRNDGARDIIWNGVINTQLADSGTYELRVVGTDQLKSAPPYTATLRFKVDRVFAPLETPLLPFADVKTGGTDTLTSRLSGFVPVLDGTKGLFVAGVAAALPLLALSKPRSSVSGYKTHLYAGIALGLTSGIVAAWWGATHRDDAAAKDENARRVALRVKYNADADARNKDRIAKTILIIRPIGG
jgi:hypothetical protein